MLLKDKLLKIRLKFKCSQAKFADMLSIAQSSVTLWENGKRLPSFQSLKKIVTLANMFGMKIDYNYLFDFDKEINGKK